MIPDTETIQTRFQQRNQRFRVIHYETKPASLAVLSDFDGTVTLTDTFEYLLKKYAQGNWQQYDEQYDRGEITLREVMNKQGAMIRVPEMVLVAEMERVIGFRPHFDKLIAYCRINKIPIGVVSAGIDLVINDLLRMKGWNHLVKVYAAKAEATPNGIRFTFPRLRDKTSLGFKDDIVRLHHSRRRRVVYVGDGRYDMPALKLTDYPFAVKGSRLAGLCRQQNIPAREITDFQEVLTAIQYDIPH